MTLDRVLAAYNLALPVGLAAMLPDALLKLHRRGGRWADLRERLGHHTPATRAWLAAHPAPVWVHAVSVGEAFIAAKLVRAWRKADPAAAFLVTTTTPTGRAIVEAELADPRILLLASPVDAPDVIARSLALFRPRELVLIESEIWPNWLSQTRAWGRPVSLVNARLSPTSERRLAALRPVAAPIYGQLSRVLVPEEADVARWAKFGVDPTALRVTGNVKYDFATLGDDPRTAEFQQLLHDVFGPGPHRFLLGASTHPGEEAALAEAYLQLHAADPTVRLLLAPRHFERAPEVLAALAKHGLRTARRTAPTPGDAPDAFLIDTTGELRAWQACAHAVVIGKSFLATGGQNPVEAIMAGVPVLCGPHMENFAPVMTLLRTAQGVTEVPAFPALPAAVQKLWADPAATTAQVTRAQTALRPHQGATARTLRALGVG